MKIRILLLLLFCSAAAAFAQDRITISGYVKDASNGEALFGANVVARESRTGVSTNNYGFYSLTLPKGSHTISFMYLGYASQEKTLNLQKDTILQVDLVPSQRVMSTTEIIADKGQDNLESTRMSSVELDIKDIKKLPAFGGEVDILKVITLLPGVKSGGEGNSGFYVRGGGPDQNLVLLDGAPVYNASHLFGFFSVFNGDAIRSAEIIKGGMPAQYGGRLSSVLDISMKEGNNKRFEVEGGLGLIASRLTVQGPIVKNKLSFIVSGRRTYADLIARPFLKNQNGGAFAGSGYYFYDINAKINWVISDKDRIYLSGYYGKDKFSFNNEESGFKAGINWGNATATLRWNHVYNSKLFSNLTLIFTDYNFGFDGEQAEFAFKLGSGVRDYGFRLDYNYYPAPKHSIRFGGEYTNHTYKPSNVTFESTVTDLVLPQALNYHTNEAAIYISDDWEISKRWRINIGARASYFAFMGPFTRYVTDQQGQTIDTVTYKPWEKIKDYFRGEPRISGRFLINERMSLKASYSMNYQYTQLVSRATVSLPLDVWLPATEKIRPQFSQQIALGYFLNFKQNMFETSVEVYYKPMRNLVEFEDGSDPAQSINDNIDNTLVQGNGESYGAEFFIRKSKGKFNGWIGYTLAWTTRRFSMLNNGKPFPARYDRRHDISLVLNYDLNYRWQFSGVFVYSTGNTLTMPSALYFSEGKLITEFGDRNAYRFPAYHRLDLGITYVTSKPDKKFKSSISLSVYNTYSRMNPFFIYYTQEGSLSEGDFKLRAKQVSLFPIVPALTWNFKY